MVHQKLSTRDPAVPLLAWWLRICANLASNHRRSARIRRVEAVAEVPETTNFDADPESIALERERRDVGAALLARLAPHQRAVLTLAVGDEMTCAQIAARTSIPLGTVFTRLRAAKAALRGMVDMDR